MRSFALVGCGPWIRWDMDIFTRTAANRRLLADFFDRLDEEQLDTVSLCDAWTVREVLGHLVMPMTGGTGGFLLKLVRAGGSVNRTSEAVARELARRPVRELTALLRDKADQHGAAPGVGPRGRWPTGVCTFVTARGRWVCPMTSVSTTGGWCSTGFQRAFRGWCRSAVSADCRCGRTTRTGPGAAEVVGPSEALAPDLPWVVKRQNCRDEAASSPRHA